MAESGSGSHNHLPSQVGPLNTGSWPESDYNKTCDTFAQDGWSVEQSPDGLTTFRPGEKAATYPEIIQDLTDRLNR